MLLTQIIANFASRSLRNDANITVYRPYSRSEYHRPITTFNSKPRSAGEFSQDEWRLNELGREVFEDVLAEINDLLREESKDLELLRMKAIVCEIMGFRHLALKTWLRYCISKDSPNKKDFGRLYQMARKAEYIHPPFSYDEVVELGKMFMSAGEMVYPNMIFRSWKNG